MLAGVAPSAGVVMVLDPTGLVVIGACAGTPVWVVVRCIAPGLLGVFFPKEKKLARLNPPDFVFFVAPEVFALANPVALFVLVSDLPVAGGLMFAILIISSYC